jgi:hypothetical protein
MRLVFVLLLGLGIPALASGEDRSQAAGLQFTAPEDWKRVPTASPLAAAQFRIPHARGDDDDGEAVLFQFEDEKGGKLSDAVERWYSQFTQPDGRPAKDTAVVTNRTVNGLSVKVVSLAGTYRPTMGAMAHPPRPGYRLLGAVVEGRGGPWYWRAVGPAATMDKARGDFDALIGSLALAQ